jgi:ribonuclease P protein component
MGLTVGRLKRRAEFLRVAATRCKWAAPGLILQAAPSAPGLPPPPSGGAAVPGQRDAKPELRVGFTCSKKVGNSVARNRAKRRLRAAAAQILPELAAAGRDYVLIGRTETLHRPFGSLLQDLRTALKRVGALRETASANTVPAGNKADGAGTNTGGEGR